MAANNAVVGILRAMITADTASFDTGMRKAGDTLKLVGDKTKKVGEEVAKLTPQAERMVKAFSGDKMIYTANSLVAAITKVGGATKLSESQQAHANKTLTDAIALYGRLGEKAPQAWVAIEQATRKVIPPTEEVARTLVKASSATTGMAGSVLALTRIFGGYLSVAAIGGAAIRTLQYAESLEKASVALGATSTATQRLENIAVGSNTTLEAMTSAITMMQDRLAGGDASAIAALRRLGLTVEQVFALNPDQQFILIAKAIAEVHSQEQQIQLGKDIFGRGAVEIIGAVRSEVDKLAASLRLLSPEQLQQLAAAETAWDQLWLAAKRYSGLAILNIGEHISNPLGWHAARIGPLAPLVLPDLPRAPNLPTQPSLVHQTDREMARILEVTRNYGLELRIAQDALAKMPAAQRREIEAAQQLGVSIEDLGNKYGVTEGVLKLLIAQTKDYEQNLKKVLDKFSGSALLKDAKEYETALKAIGGAQHLTAAEGKAVIDVFEAIIEKYRLLGPPGAAVVAHFTALRAALNKTDAGAQVYLENELRGFQASQVILAARDAAGIEYLQGELIRLNALDLGARDYLDNEHRGWQASISVLEERDRAGNEFLRTELARMAALEGTKFEDPFSKAMERGLEARTRTLEMWKRQAGQLEGATIGRLGTLFFGNLGKDLNGQLRAAADEAHQDFLRIQRSGKATAEELTLAMRRWRESEDHANVGFAERWTQFMGGIKQTFVGVLDEMLQHFLRSFIGGLIKGMVSARLGQTLGNALMGSVAGTAIGGGAAALAGGSGAAAAVAGVESAALGGTAAGGGATLAALATNPWTIGAAGAIALGLLVAKKGLFRGGEEAMHVNPRRDQFTAQFGGGHNLAARLTGLSGEHGGGHLFAALQRADSVKEFEAAQSAIAAFLGQFKQRVKLFNFGGFVPPGVTQPAILHGGAFGEDVISRTSSQPSAGPSLSIHNTFNISSIDARGVREFVESRDFLDSFARVIEHNKGFIATRVRPSLVS